MLAHARDVLEEANILWRISSYADFERVVTTKQGFSLERVDVNVFDDTFGAMLSLCGRAAKSAAYFKTSHTILLLSNPAFRSEKRPLLCVNSSTHVDVDPCMTDTEWLRRFAQSLTTKEAVNIPFPERGRTEDPAIGHFYLVVESR